MKHSSGLLFCWIILFIVYIIVKPVGTPKTWIEYLRAAFWFVVVAFIIILTGVIF